MAKTKRQVAEGTPRTNRVMSVQSTKVWRYQ